MGTLTSVLSLGPGEEEDETKTTLVGCHKICICRGGSKSQAALDRGNQPTHPMTTAGKAKGDWLYQDGHSLSFSKVGVN